VQPPRLLTDEPPPASTSAEPQEVSKGAVKLLELPPMDVQNSEVHESLAMIRSLPEDEEDCKTRVRLMNAYQRWKCRERQLLAALRSLSEANARIELLQNTFEKRIAADDVALKSVCKQVDEAERERDEYKRKLASAEKVCELADRITIATMKGSTENRDVLMDSLYEALCEFKQKKTDAL
jgi:hypothetical protein